MVVLQREMLSDAARNQLEQLIEAHDPMGKLLAWARRQQREQAVVNERSEVQGSGQEVCDDCSDCDSDRNSRAKTSVNTHHLDRNAGRRNKNSKSRHCRPSDHKCPRRDIRLPAVGSVITRDYFGSEIAVRVLEQGFEYVGQRFRSLSAIAKAVTGNHWNGYLFFGFSRQEK